MYYISTRGGAQRLSAAEVIAKSLAEDGGLFVPESFPLLTEKDIINLASMHYSKRAAFILGMFLDDFSREELSGYSDAAYNGANFSHPSIVPLYKLDSKTFFLELGYGPTCAFKDMALQILPYLLPASLRKINEKREVCILAATSGDTGKAALEGFHDVPGTRIIVFYPRDGVSDIQKLQMTSQRGKNVYVVAVDGNFDDTQAGVKAIFSDEEMRCELSGSGYILSSANSINWGRLAPQIAYYVSSYCDLLAAGEIKPGERINFCVPTGNFGNILAAYYAGKIGLPVNRLVCASNRNDVLNQFISTGVYDINRPFFTTISPSMDILISSNLERLLFEMSDRDGGAVASYMSALAGSGRYEISRRVRDKISSIFTGGLCNEEDTKRTIADVFNRYNYLIDTHTAVGYKVLGDYRAASGDQTPSVVISTASPFKFCDSVISALDSSSADRDGVDPAELLSEISGCLIPPPLAALKNLPQRFHDSVAIRDMKSAVMDFLRQRNA